MLFTRRNQEKAKKASERAVAVRKHVPEMPNVVSMQQVRMVNNSTTSCADIVDENTALHGARFVMHVVKPTIYEASASRHRERKHTV